MKISIIKKLCWLLIIGVSSVSILPNIFFNYWFVDIFSNFRIQYLVISISLLLVSLFIFKKKMPAVLILLVIVFWNSYYIVPYYIKSDSLQFGAENELKISSINLLSSNHRIDLVTDYIRNEDPEVIILMEFTPEWEQELQPILEEYQFKQLVPRTDNFGIALLSKYQMKSSIDYFDLNNKPSIIGDLKIKNEVMTIIATHPIPPIGQAAFENRNKQLINIINRRSQYSENLIIGGDFNTSSFSNHFDKLLQNDLKDSRLGFGLLPTWPANFGILQTTLDHFIISKSLKVIKRSTGANIGSDHLPINIVIGIK